MKIYLMFLSMHIKSQMQYKVSFFFTALGQFLISFSALLSIVFMFSRFNQVNGFSFEEILLCFALIQMSFALAECFGRGFDTFHRMIGNGEFDRILVRPQNEIFQVFCSKIELTRIGRILQAVIVFVYAFITCDIIWNIDQIITIILMIVCGTVVFCSLFLLAAAVSFFTLSSIEIFEILTAGGKDYGKYPYSIYGKKILFFLTYIIPLALFQYYPLLYLLGKENNIFYMYMPLLSLLFIIPSYTVWRFGLRKYKSTGS